MLTSILQIAESVTTSLQAEKESFDELRAMESRADRVLDEMATGRERSPDASRGPGPSWPRSRTHLLPGGAGLHLAQPGPGPANCSPPRMRRWRPAGAPRGRRPVRGGRQRPHRRAGDRHADRLLTAVAGANTALAESGRSWKQRLASAHRRHQGRRPAGDGRPGVVAAREDARTAISAGHDARAVGDPLAALSRLEKAETALDAALAPHREREVNVRRFAGLVAERIPGWRGRSRARTPFISSTAVRWTPHHARDSPRRAACSSRPRPPPPPTRRWPSGRWTRPSASPTRRSSSPTSSGTTSRGTAPAGGGGGGVDVGSLISAAS
jgi:hypothetical protein